jgi:hypothetical protein
MTRWQSCRPCPEEVHVTMSELSDPSELSLRGVAQPAPATPARGRRRVVRASRRAGPVRPRQGRNELARTADSVASTTTCGPCCRATSPEVRLVRRAPPRTSAIILSPSNSTSCVPKAAWATSRNSTMRNWRSSPRRSLSSSARVVRSTRAVRSSRCTERRARPSVPRRRSRRRQLLADTEPGSRPPRREERGSDPLLSSSGCATRSGHLPPHLAAAPAGSGDSGGMNVYVRELVSALAQAGVECTTFTRADRAGPARRGRRRTGPPGRPHRSGSAPPPERGAAEVTDEFRQRRARLVRRTRSSPT